MKKSLLFLPLILFFFWAAETFAACQIKITWDPNSEPDLAGYKVYYGTSSRNYGDPIDIGNIIIFTIESLTPEVTFFIAVTAYDNDGNESGYSNEVSGVCYDATPSAPIGFGVEKT